MALEKEPVNKVSRKDILTIDLESFLPGDTQIAVFDIKDYLYKKLILKEKEFRAAMKSHMWDQYHGKYLCITCSSDAVIPLWAYMLIASCGNEHSESVYYTDEKNAYNWIILEKISKLQVEDFENRRVIVKGCSNKALDPSVYIAITNKLQPVVRSLQFGEACSMVPVFKK
ncbi:MAG: DUF2480 family protein [Chitinophagales bacterium]|nr:DUF2480 family protein [Chitinophagales bacterium]